MKTEEEKFELFCSEIDKMNSVLGEYVTEDYRKGMMDGIRRAKAYAAIHLTDLPHDYKMKLIFREPKKSEDGK